MTCDGSKEDRGKRKNNNKITDLWSVYKPFSRLWPECVAGERVTIYFSEFEGWSEPMRLPFLPHRQDKDGVYI